MFILQEMLWQITRKRGQAAILLLASSALAICIAFYLGNIRANEEAMERLAKSTDVEVLITSATGENSAGLNIDTMRCDNFLSNPYLQDFRYSVSAVGAYSKEAREERVFTGGDVNVLGLNCVKATWMPDGKYEYTAGFDESFLAGDEPYCLIDKSFAERNNIGIEDEISMPVYLVQFRQGGSVDYISLREQTLRVVGFSSSEIIPQEFIVPVGWLRKISESQDVDFAYSSCTGYMRDPRQLNQFKASIESMSFLKPNPDARDQFAGITIVVEDELFISSAEPLEQNILLFHRFMIPFFLLLVGLIKMAIFLIMRGSRRDIAIACSLGRPRILCGLVYFLTAVAAELAGCIVIFPAILLGAKMSVAGGLLVCGAFMLFACVGNGLALAVILRFDTLALLTAD